MIDDTVIKNQLKAFIQRQGIQHFDESRQFEYLVNYVIFSLYSDNLNLEDFDTEGTSGIDGAAVIINNQLVTSMEVAREIIEHSSGLDVEFIFISSKTSPTFKTEFISNIFSNVKEFFDKKESLKTINANSCVAEILRIKNKIYERSDILSQNPLLRIFLCTTGKWDAKNHRSLITREIRELKGTNLFKDVRFEAFGCNELQDLYRRTERALDVTVQLDSQIPLPDLQGVKSAYITIIKACEFIKILSDSQKYINGNVFYENVRDFQDDKSEANQNMKITLKDASRRDKFCLYNNGITILAKEGNITGKNITLKDYQIVNGCQTSNVVFNAARDGEDLSNVLIPVKIIIAPDETIREDIIRSTNTQKVISSDQFISLTPFSREIEEYFKAFADDNKVYYERRDNQYRGTDTPKTRIITQKTLIKIIGAVVKGVPDEVIRRPISFYKERGKDMFQEDCSKEVYYVFSYLYCCILEYLRDNAYKCSYNKLILYILYVAKHMITGKDISTLKGKKAKKFLDKFTEAFHDRARLGEVIKISIDMLNEYSTIEETELNKLSTKKFREGLDGLIKTYSRKNSEYNID